MNWYFCLFPYNVWECWWLAPLAFVLDRRLGDPRLPWPHPVCLLGFLLNVLEKPARTWEADVGHSRTSGRVAGIVCLLMLVFCAGLAVRACVALPLFGSVLGVYFAWAGLALGSLLTTGKDVLENVERGAEAEAREALSHLVSRDVRTMDRRYMRKTLADTLSENFTDAFLAPYFWLLVAGPVGLWCYKAVSTGDSMWGYLTEKWRNLGFAFARGDDILAFVPARISVVVMGSADFVLRLLQPRARVWTGRWPGLSAVAQQARGMPSPNSGWSMAVCAWLCNARMAGPSVYFGALVDKPWLGPSESEAAHWDEARLNALLALMRAGGLFGALSLWLVGLLIWLLPRFPSMWVDYVAAMA